MRALIQRVSRASVTVAEERLAAIGDGLLVLVAAGREDAEPDALRLAGKVARLRVFGDESGRMNRALADAGGSALVVPQFTLYADTRRGNRPSFVDAAPPEQGARLVDAFADELERLGIPVARGRFGAHMQVELTNDGPVTIWLDAPAGA